MSTLGSARMPFLHLPIFEVGDTSASMEFVGSCRLGNLPDIRHMKPTQVEVDVGFGEACANGHLPAVEYLITLNPSGFHIAWGFRKACENGMLGVAKYLSTYLTKQDMKSYDNWAFWMSCNNNHAEVVKWLVNAAGISKRDIRSDDNRALRFAYRNGNLHLAEWIISHCDICRGTVSRYVTTEDAEHHRWLVKMCR